MLDRATGLCGKITTFLPGAIFPAGVPEGEGGMRDGSESDPVDSD